MRLPVLRGLIERRILANFRIEPEVLARVLPRPFRPKLVGGTAMGGVCLIRLKSVRPGFVPGPCGLRSENAAHRFAVEWDHEGERCEGVYVPRRDTDSWLSQLAGGRLFPGVHHRARFTVEESGEFYSVSMKSDDGDTRVRVAGSIAEDIPGESVFASLGEASEFFERGSVGYSATRSEGRYDGLELRCESWHVDPLDVCDVESSYFEDKSLFPPDTVEFDCALLMRDIPHEWQGREELCCSGARLPGVNERGE